MEAVAASNERIIAAMAKSFFGVSPDGWLIYNDPIIGALINEEKGLAARVDLDGYGIELRFRDEVKRVFSFKQGVGNACRGAFAAYFNEYAELCSQAAQAMAA